MFPQLAHGADGSLKDNLDRLPYECVPESECVSYVSCVCYRHAVNNRSTYMLFDNSLLSFPQLLVKTLKKMLVSCWTC